MYFYFLVLIKFIIGFALIITYFNLSGRTQMSQMNAIDLIGNFVLGGIIGGIIYSEAIPLYEYVLVLLLGIMVLFFLNTFCKKYHIFRNIAVGRPIPIIKDGVFIMENILKKKNKIDIFHIASRLNSQGIYSFDEISYAQIEPDGSVTAICDKNSQPAIIVFHNGNVRDTELRELGITKHDLLNEMELIGIKDPNDVFLGEYWQGNLKCILKDGSVRPRKFRSLSSLIKKKKEIVE